jgi:hemolysin III
MIKRLLLKDHTNQTQLEEIINSLLHLIGAGLGIAALCILVVLSVEQDDTYKIVGCSIFGATLILMYSASAVYHAVRKSFWKQIYKIVDHSAIYLLIAGTYTPILLVTLHGAWGWTLFGIVWGLAAGGLVFKFFFTGRFEHASTIIYLGMGWLAMVAIKPIYEALPAAGLAWLAAGGLSYTLGVVFYMWDRLHFGHAIWHLFVLGGSICHFFLILLYVVPARAP